MSTHGEDTRTRLLDMALKLLVDRGYHGVGIDEIARAAGVSRQAVYQHHFKSKSELLLAMVEHVDRKVGVPAAVEKVMRTLAADVLEGLDAMVATMVEIDAQIVDVVQVIEGARTTDAAAEAAWQDRLKLRWKFIRRVIGQLAEEGRLAPAWTADDATDFTWALISPANHRMLVIDKKWRRERYVHYLRRALRDTLVRAPGGKPVGARRGARSPR